MGRERQARRDRQKAKTLKPGGAGSSVGYWAVCYLDLMGYRRCLHAADIYPLPRDKAAQDELTRKVVRPYHFRRRLLHGVESFMSGIDGPGADLSRFPPDHQRLAATWRSVRIKHSAIGDAVILEMPLRPDERHFPARALDTMLTAACSASLLQLAAGADDPENTLPLRGGVDIGTGAVFEGQLYSAAQAKAVALETEANYPRILVGDRLREYVDSMADSQGEDLTTKYVRALMGAARGFFFQDPDDGRWCLDFLGRQFQRRAGVPSTLVRSAHLFVSKALGHFGDERLQRKYEWLDKYVRSRLPLWGLT